MIWEAPTLWRRPSGLEACSQLKLSELSWAGLAWAGLEQPWWGGRLHFSLLLASGRSGQAETL